MAPFTGSGQKAPFQLTLIVDGYDRELMNWKGNEIIIRNEPRKYPSLIGLTCACRPDRDGWLSRKLIIGKKS